MPTFEIVGRGKATGRKRKRTLRVLDRETALAAMDTEDTIVDECVELPYPTSSPELRDHVRGLGVTISDDASLPECVFEVLRWCIVNRRCARIRHLTDVQGNPWTAVVEPHGFKKSREGFRLRCYLPPAADEPDVVFDFQIAGWHLYLIEDVEQVEAISQTFEERPYRRTGDEIAVTEGGWK